MAEFFNELGWKNDNPFFVGLNTNLERMKESCLMANNDLRNIQNYFNQINTFKIFYAPYIKSGDTKILDEMNFKFKSAKEKIQSLDFVLYLMGKKKEDPELYQDIILSLNNLNDVIEIMINNLERNGVLPKVLIKKKYDPSKAIQQTTY